MAKIDRRDYAALYGPTTGDRCGSATPRSSAVVEKDHAVYGDECLHGGGKTLRDGIGMAGITSAEGALDFLLCNVMVIDPVLGIVKGDLGIRHGRIVGHRQGRQPRDHGWRRSAPHRLRRHHGARLRGADRDHRARSTSMCISTAPGWSSMRLASGITTMIGGSLGPITVGIDSGGPFNTGKMLQAAEAWPMNFGFLGTRQFAQAAAAGRAARDRRDGPEAARGLGRDAGRDRLPACGSPTSYDFQVQIHTDTLNEIRLRRGYAGSDRRPHHPYVPYRGRRRRPCARHHQRRRRTCIACRPRPIRPIPTRSTPSTNIST